MDSTEPKKVYKTSESQRAATKRYKDKIKDTEEYKQKTKTWTKNYIENHKEKYNEYHREYQKALYYKNKLQDEKQNKFVEEECKIFFPNIE